MNKKNITKAFNILSLDKFNDIKFYGSNHTYKINNEICPLSVTRFLNLFIKEFDKVNIAKRCAQRDGVDVHEVLSKWEMDKDLSCIKGTLLHHYIDNYLARKILPVDETLINNFCKQYNSEDIKQEFLKSLAKLIIQFEKFYTFYTQNFAFIKSEFVVGDVSDTRICGTIDNLSLDLNTNMLTIIDYKTNKDFTTKNKYGDKLLYPIQHLDNTKLNVYGLQLSIYKYIIKKYINCDINLLIVWFNENNDTYKLFTPPNLDAEVVDMMNYYKQDKKHTTLTTSTEEYIESLSF